MLGLSAVLHAWLEALPSLLSASGWERRGTVRVAFPAGKNVQERRIPTGDMAGPPSQQDSSDLMPTERTASQSPLAAYFLRLCSWGGCGRCGERGHRQTWNSTAPVRTPELGQDAGSWPSSLGAIDHWHLISDTQQPTRLTDCGGQYGRQPSPCPDCLYSTLPSTHTGKAQARPGRDWIPAVHHEV